jgi:hypothetical protein
VNKYRAEVLTVEELAQRHAEYREALDSLTAATKAMKQSEKDGALARLKAWERNAVVHTARGRK